MADLLYADAITHDTGRWSNGTYAQRVYINGVDFYATKLYATICDPDTSYGGFELCLWDDVGNLIWSSPNISGSTRSNDVIAADMPSTLIQSGKYYWIGCAGDQSQGTRYTTAPAGKSVTAAGGISMRYESNFNANWSSGGSTNFPTSNGSYYVSKVGFGGVTAANTAPDAPTNLNPGSTDSTAPESVATLTPRLSWTYSDPDGDPQGQYQVIIYKTADNTIVKDTGTIVSGNNYYDVPADLLTADTGYYWKVRVTDNVDTAAWSTYSAVEYVKTTKAPVPTPTSPLGTSTSPAGTDTTPRMTWDYFDAEAHAQQSFQVKISDTAATLVHDSGVTASTNKYYDVPAAVLTAGVTYYWELQVTDSTGMVSSWTAAEYFLTNTPPGSPGPTAPADTKRVPVRPVFEATIGDDPENDGQHFVIQIADDSGFTTGLQERNTETATAGWEVKTSTGSYVAMPTGGVDSSYEGGTVKHSWQADLTEGKTYYWRIAAIDATTGSRGDWTAARSIRVGDVLAFTSAPVTTSAAAQRLVMSIQKLIPTDGTTPATFKVEAANNANDTSPAWEDITTAVNSGQYYQFTNTEKTATDWAVAVKITIEAKDSLGPIEVDGFGFSFD